MKESEGKKLDKYQRGEKKKKQDKKTNKQKVGKGRKGGG